MKTQDETLSPSVMGCAMPVIMLVLPAHFGDDPFEIFVTHGGNVLLHREHKGLLVTEQAHEALQVAKKFNPEAVFVETFGIGAAIVGHLWFAGREVTERGTQATARTRRLVKDAITA